MNDTETEGWAYAASPRHILSWQLHYFVSGVSLCENVTRKPDAGRWAFGSYPSPFIVDVESLTKCRVCKRRSEDRARVLMAEERERVRIAKIAKAEYEALLQEQSQWEPFDG